MSRLSFAALALALAGQSFASPAQFVIDAQYRGIVNKGFPGIGSATVNAVEAGDGTLKITGSGKVTHPQTSAKFQATVQMTVRVAGDRLETLSATQKCNPGSEPFMAQMQKVMPLLAVVQSSAGDARSGETRTLSTPSGAVSLSFREAGGKLEVTANQGGTQVGKFFLAPSGGSVRVEKFRVPAPENNVSLNFVASGSARAGLSD